MGIEHNRKIVKVEYKYGNIYTVKLRERSSPAIVRKFGNKLVCSVLKHQNTKCEHVNAVKNFLIENKT